MASFSPRLFCLGSQMMVERANNAFPKRRASPAPRSHDVLSCMGAMMSRYFTVGIVFGLILFVPIQVRADGASSPGKFAAAASQTGVNLGNVPTTLSVQLLKGKRKRLLVVTGTTQVDSFGGDIFADVTANGIVMEPTNGSNNTLTTTCSNNCTLTGTWWLDLDVAELANPGALVNVPINVAFNTRADDNNGGLFKLSVTATLVRK